jgi:hypothetical protein
LKLGAVVNILSSALLLAAPVLARESTDVIVMKNGDRITCEVKGLSGLVAGGPSGKQAVGVVLLHQDNGQLSWNISFYGNWDNRPPGNLPGSNYGTSSGLAWTFGSSLRTTPRTIQ